MKRDRIVSLRLTSQEYESFRLAALEHDVTISRLIRRQLLLVNVNKVNIDRRLQGKHKHTK